MRSIFARDIYRIVQGGDHLGIAYRVTVRVDTEYLDFFLTPWHVIFDFTDEKIQPDLNLREDLYIETKDGTRIFPDKFIAPSISCDVVALIARATKPFNDAERHFGPLATEAGWRIWLSEVLDDCWLLANFSRIKLEKHGDRDDPGENSIYLLFKNFFRGRQGGADGHSGSPLTGKNGKILKGLLVGESHGPLRVLTVDQLREAFPILDSDISGQRDLRLNYQETVIGHTYVSEWLAQLSKIRAHLVRIEDGLDEVVVGIEDDISGDEFETKKHKLQNNLIKSIRFLRTVRTHLPTPLLGEESIGEFIDNYIEKWDEWAKAKKILNPEWHEMRTALIDLTDEVPVKETFYKNQASYLARCKKILVDRFPQFPEPNEMPHRHLSTTLVHRKVTEKQLTASKK